MEITGLNKLNAALSKLAAKYGKSAAVKIGYSASYSLWVHENLAAYHPVGQSKYLEEPARANQEIYAAIVKQGLKAGLTMEQALLRAGLQLQSDSQALCPVDTGNLRNSAFTKPE